MTNPRRVPVGTPISGQFDFGHRDSSLAPPPATKVHDDDDDDVGISLAQVALWAGTGEDEEPLDTKYDISDIEEDSLQKEVANAQKFWDEATALGLTDWCDKDMFVHNFWLDRNGHGTGFWDHCPDEVVGEQLSEMAKQYGHCDLLEGDDGALWFCPN
jgi:hypothetical protein